MGITIWRVLKIHSNQYRSRRLYKTIENHVIARIVSGMCSKVGIGDYRVIPLRVLLGIKHHVGMV